MSEITDFDSLRRAMAENGEQPEGPARNARAEQLLVEAERLDIPLAVIEALGHQLKVYNYSSEKAKMFVPFARLLRMWDERPGDFDEYETHSLHWVFKWMSAGMLDQPHVPLASVEKWLGEMEHRYRLAGHSARAVRSAEFSVAAHVGDVERAERAFAAWLAADRDTMADCHACELHGQGWWQAERGRDAEALAVWAPVLEGEYTCAHEPHTVLASSLLPLLRLSRLEEARAHHLRGFRLVRSMESMRGAYADHVEFCALTGNEARGLELLAERPAYFTDEGHPHSRMEFLSVVVLLMERLSELGLAGQRVPGPAGREWTAEELADHARAQALALAARFDERNGTSYVSERARARMAQRPLVERLPLGVRATRPASTVAAAASGDAAPAPAAVRQVAEPDLAVLLAEARRLSDTLQPHAVEAWARVARLAEETEGVELDARDRAEIADHAAIGLGPEGAETFEHAAELYERAGDPGEALAARARAAYVRALAGEIDEALAAVADPYDQVLALYAEGGTGVPQAAGVLMGRARILMRRVHEAEGEVVDEAVLAKAEAAVRELLALVDGRAGNDVRLAARVAEGHAMLAELATHSGNPEAGAELFARAAAEFVETGLPWFAVEYEARLAGLAHQLGDMGEAERALRAALEHGGPYLEAVGRAQLHLQLAEVLGGRGAAEEAAEHALEAAHWADEAGAGPTLGAWARHQLGGFLVRQGHWAEAAEVLESALAELTVETHGDGAVVQTQWWLGDCLSELGEHRDAAERRLQAADIARHWPEQHDHATLAHLAAESLGQAGLPLEADQGYARAGELWRGLGNVHGLVRSLRARAWLALRTENGTAAARALMTSAVEECADAFDAADDDEARLRLVSELGHTHRQFGDLLARTAAEDADDDSIRATLDEALSQMAEAVAVFAALGEGAVHARTGAELAAGWLETDLGRPAAAAARARAVLRAYADADADAGDDAGADAAVGSGEEEGETVQARLAEAEQLLHAAEEQQDR
ncbi:tetratricopeptide repeat protein [Streptomyces rishiriensis]|uniref:Tetratricopeptide (TPR) repeat protein n=1 Tax=Streptomyces rishiriensis TaxID=68264 RepID=A0ABU0NX31_STRRH|nr:tetratricopeptide repeat protein [Streptomyces rishiriensis]MDQ0583696.1 tetratricopeptide (TPR) repeat protein [Streptomyces rishiriensis]